MKLFHMTGDRRLDYCVRWILLGLTPLGWTSAYADNGRIFSFTYEVEVADVASDEAVDVFIPLPVENADQHILNSSINSPLAGTVGEDAEYGNSYYKMHRPAGDDTPLRLSATWQVHRNVVGIHETDLTPASEARFLGANTLVPVSHEVLAPILAEIRAMREDTSPEATTRAIYDWVVDNVEYKKVGTGWGNGDTFWACSERYGNCTDFHALFTSLARTEGIPARFEIGFPVPEDRPAGVISGYHCWIRVYLPGQGWLPIDASEAAKFPEKRELLFGTQPTDRIQFTIGRDLVISAATKRNPLNYFIYPHVEVGGQPYSGEVQTRFSFK